MAQMGTVMEFHGGYYDSPLPTPPPTHPNVDPKMRNILFPGTCKSLCVGNVA